MKVRRKKSKSLKILKSVVLVLFLSLLFVPDNINRSVIAGIALAGILGSLLFLIVPRLPLIPSLALKRKSARSSGNPDGITDMETLLWRQISYQITGKLKSSYPNATWEFTKEPTVDSLLNGNALRIRTFHTKEYNFAEVRLDCYGELVLSMMTIESLKPKSEPAGTDSIGQVDPQSWYTLIGKPLLSNLIGDLQARGHQKLFISENGEIFIKNGDSKEIKGTFEHFPPQNYWAALTDIFIRDELNAKENEGTLELSWM